MKKILFMLLVLFFFSVIPEACFSLGWKDLHEQADKISLKQALLAATIKPGSIEDLYVLGLVYLNLHKDKEAQQAFERIIRFDRQTQEARWGLAEALRRQNKLDESEKILNEVIKDNPEFSPAYISLGYLKYTQAEFKKTVELAAKVMKQGREAVDLSNFTRSYLLFAGAKGMLAQNGGPLAKVINGTAVLPNLKKAEELQPDSAAVLFGLGSFYFLAPFIAGGNRDKALAYLEKAIATDPLFADAYVRLGQVYKMKGDNEKFQYYLDKALQIDPHNALAQDAKQAKCKFICVTLDN